MYLICEKMMQAHIDIKLEEKKLKKAEVKILS